MKKNGIYIAGWEFNRVLADDPFEERHSALPANMLWNGCAQFWLFENVYCSQASLDGDILASEELNWKTGFIFDDLRKCGLLKPFRWSSLKDSPVDRDNIVRQHSELKRKNDSARIREIIETGNRTELEKINFEILRPILERLNCIANVNPSNVSNWFDTPQKGQISGLAKSPEHLIVQSLRDGSIQTRAGAKICENPKTKLSEEDVRAQEAVEINVQGPLMPSLMTGELSQSDFSKIVREKAGIEIYRPVSEYVWAEYSRNRGSLLKVRDIASKYLWKDLHEDWLPRYEADPAGFLPEFKALLDRALRHAAFGNCSHFFSELSIGIVGALSSVAGSTLGGVLRRRREEVRNLVLFYQKVSEHLPDYDTSLDAEYSLRMPED